MRIIWREELKEKSIIHFIGIKITCKKVPKGLIQNKKSQVEFYLIDTFEIFHFLPIYKKLLSDGIKVCIVAEPCAINTSKSWFDYETATKILKDLNIDYKTKCNPNAKVAITTQTPQILKKYHHKKAVLSYGIGLNKNNFSISQETCKNCDIRLVHGKYQKEKLSKYINKNKIFEIGYPKHEAFFEQKLNKNDLLKKYNITTTKPVLVYFPTWDDDSSIQLFGDEINALRNQYYIITKAHHCTYRLPEKQQDKDKLYKISDYVLEGNCSFEDAAMLGDFALIDAKSGASTEVPYLNKEIKTILLSPRQNLCDYFNDDIIKNTHIINSPDVLKQEIDFITKDNNINTGKKSIEYFYKTPAAGSTKYTADIIKGFLK